MNFFDQGDLRLKGMATEVSKSHSKIWAGLGNGGSNVHIGRKGHKHVLSSMPYS